jgi:enamine deaminase RidA (YjgF/YER057c/UK114 family)
MTGEAVTLIRSKALTDAAPYAYAAMAQPGSRLIFTARACPPDDAGETLAPGDIAAQAEQVMRNLQTALAITGASLTDFLKTTLYVATRDQADLLAPWNVVRLHFADHDAPSILPGASILGYRNQLVEVEAVAVILRLGIAGSESRGWHRGRPSRRGRPCPRSATGPRTNKRGEHTWQHPQSHGLK